MSETSQVRTGVIALGPQLSGKTVFLTCLYYHGSTIDPEYVITVERGEEIIIGKYLRRFLKRKWPLQTGRKEFNNIILTISEEKQGSRFIRPKKIMFQIPDYAGQLLTLPHSPEPGILSKIRKNQELSMEERKVVNHIKDAQGYVLVIDPELPEVSEKNSFYDREYLQMDYMTLINELGRSGVLNRPILVLTTKWDLVKMESCEQHMDTEFRMLSRHLKTKCQKDKLDFAAVWLENDTQGPKVPLQPMGYSEVLKWFVKVLK